MPVPVRTTSAAGSLALLHDDDKDIRGSALQHLIRIVDEFWAEISEDLAWIESLADPQQRELAIEDQPTAALLLSKVYYYLGEIDEAVSFALNAQEVFESQPDGEYKQTIIAGCIDRAIALTQTDGAIDPRLERIIEGVVRSGSAEGAKLAIGLALSLRRLSLIENIYLSSRATPSSSASSSQSRIVKSSDGVLHDEALLRYILSEAIGGAGGSDAWPESFRASLFDLLLKLFQMTSPPDYNAITQIWVQAGSWENAANGIADLLEQGETGKLEAYQIAFDLTEMASQGYMVKLRTKLTERGWLGEGTANALRQSGTQEIRTTLEEILNGSRGAELFLNFLKKNNHTDMSILKVTRESLEDRYSIYHSAITFTNAFAHCGTSSDRFLRENLDFLGRASNWAKFSATAALGLIHRGSYMNGIRHVKPYLPGGSAPSKFSEGGALFALGLIYAGRKQGAEQELRKGLAEGNHAIVQHGAALGLGVAAIATGDEDIYDELKNILFQDNATSSEAAGYAMGLVMLDHRNQRVIDEMLSYAGETQHEKIVRGVAVGLALMSFEQRDTAMPVIARLTQSNDAILRYGGMFAYAMAYVGTGDNVVVGKLLHYAVSDVNDDVRRAAVIALGFVLFRNYTQVPRVVQLLSESYNPHVRHGATLALGISCAGTGLETAIELLEPLTKDPVDFVRQGAYIALAMVLIQQTEAQSSKVSTIRELFAKIVADKHDDPMARFGASLAQGIIDAGGRNMTISLATRAGQPDMKAVVGMAMFVQFWYWFPLGHFLGLCFSPTTIIAVDGELRVPKVGFISWARPSMFDYPSTAKPVTEEKKKKAKAAVLSTTAKAQARAKSKRAAEGETMDTDDKVEEIVDVSKKEKDGKEKESRKISEPNLSYLINMSRVTPSQLPFITGPYDSVSPSANSKASATTEVTSAAPTERTSSTTTPPVTTTTTAAATPKSPLTTRRFFRPLRDVGDSAAYDSDRRADGRARPAWSGKVVVLANLGSATGGEAEKEVEYLELDPMLWPRGAVADAMAARDARGEATRNGASGEGDAEQGSGSGSGGTRGSSAMSAAQGDDWDAPVPGPFEFDFE